MAAPLISAIICTHNREEYLGAAIDSLLAQNMGKRGPNSYEIIVVDNASTDGTAAIAQARQNHPNFRYIYESTLGLSVARNCGAQAAKGNIIAYLDDDAEASTGWLAALLGAFESNENIAIAGGKVTLIWPPGIQPPRWLSEDLASGLGAYDLGDELTYIQQPSLTPRGLNYAVRKSFLNAVGGFDTNLGRVGKNLLSNEEQHLTRLALNRQQQVAYIPEALAAHNVAPERTKPGWFLSRSWWQGISESYREQVSGNTGPKQLRHGGERLLRGLVKMVKYSRSPSLRFENFAYAYGQIAYLGSVIRHMGQQMMPGQVISARSPVTEKSTEASIADSTTEHSVT
ncbi:MAG: glycosyltransferase [Cyanobacteria bacterium J06634_6]